MRGQEDKSDNAANFSSYFEPGLDRFQRQPLQQRKRVPQLLAKALLFSKGPHAKKEKLSYYDRVRCLDLIGCSAFVVTANPKLLTTTLHLRFCSS